MTRRVSLIPLVIVVLAGLAIALAAAAPRGEAPRRCVGMFVDPERKRNFVASPNDLVPVDVARIPCRDRVIGWAGQGIFRVFEDGTVETLVSPMPPCPEGDFFLWIRYPG